MAVFGETDKLVFNIKGILTKFSANKKWYLKCHYRNMSVMLYKKDFDKKKIINFNDYPSDACLLAEE